MLVNLTCFTGVVKLKPFLLLISVLAASLSACFNVHAQESFAAYETEYTAARQQILDGHVKDGVGQMAALFLKIDPSKEPNNYWSLGTTLSDFLHQIQSYQDESTVLSQLATKKLHASNLIMTQQIQLRAGRNLAFTGHANEAEKLLREVTAGDARLVHNPMQREAARLLSQIELDRENVSQSAIWMRRAVIGALVDKGCSSEEIVDTLTDYATYLRRTRRIFESHDLLTKLISTYDQTFPHLGPKYLHFAAELLESDRAVGNFGAADSIYKFLKENVQKVDIVAPSIRTQLFYHDLYSTGANSPPEGNPELASRLKKLAGDYPDWIKQPDSRIIFAYFSLLAGDLDQAKSYAASRPDQPESTRIAAYELIIQSYITARENEFSNSIVSLDAALTKISLYHHEFSDESPSKLPTISFEERAVLTAILSLLAPNAASSPQQADSVFRLEQFLNRDKAKLSLSAKVARQSASSDLQKEDIRTRDRLKDLRERLMQEGANQLLSRTQPIKSYTSSKTNDFAFLIRLEEIEGKIATIDEEIHKSTPGLGQQANERMLSLEEAKRLLAKDEAIVSHVLIPGKGIAISCVTAEQYQFRINAFSPPELKQLLVDDKLVSAALRSINEPSRELDASFPAESAFRLYRATLGPIESCLDRKSIIFLATDADLFSTPWNALLTEFDINKPFKHKTAAWMIRSHAISLLPSVSSLSQLRLNMPNTAATESFLGIGDPDFKGQPDPSVQLALAPLVGTRGVGSKDAIKQLPRLPEAAVELENEAKILGARSADLLLGSQATEKEFRSKPLENYKIISFASHALVAGESDGLTEPALVLTPSDEENNPKNDGLLTSTEIADLALDANLVILSACNTAAPDGRINSRGLSGLADAFFFAGARSIAVTQWAVYSDAAEHIGSGMVTRLAKNRDLDIAEALRQTALDFISSAAEDYLAHPRFWAAFIIAGDGSVAPLGRNANREKISANKVRIDREVTLDLSEQADLIDLTDTQSQTNFALGMARPPAGEKRFGSYTLAIGPNGIPEMVDLDHQMAASHVFDFKDSIGITGFYPSTCTTCPQGAGKTAAVFKLIRRDGHVLWTVIREKTAATFGAQMVKTVNGFILASLETDFASDHKNSIWLTAVSSDGNVLQEKQIALPFTLSRISKGATLDAAGDLILAVSGQYPVSPQQRTKIQTNPLTGTKTFCPQTNSSIIFLINPGTLDVKASLEASDEAIIRLRTTETAIFAVTNTNKGCQLTNRIRLIKADVLAQRIEALFQTNAVNSVEAEDFEATGEGFVIVGRVSILLPPILVRPIMTLEQLQNPKRDYLNDSIFDTSDSVMNALILNVRRDGTFLGDKVIHDARSGSLAGVAARGENRYLALGSALAGKGWLIQFGLTN
jgi:CHAT domain-containing protein